jgi:dienelactone hydrolase
VTLGLKVLAAAYRGDGRPAVRTRWAGVDALVARPSGGFGPVVVYANAATPLGVEQPFVRRFLGGLANAGFVAVAPELPRVRDGEVTPATVEALVAVVGDAGPRVALVGVSTGAGLSLLAAADPRVARGVVGVAAVAPFASLKSVLRLGTTGYYDDRPYVAAPLVARAAARSLAASAPDDPAVPLLLENRDPRRFDRLYAQLEPATRALVRDLSPATHIDRVLAPVELASEPDDSFFPVGESLLLARAGRDVSLVVTSSLEHVRPLPRPGVVFLVSLLGRTLHRLASGESTVSPAPRVKR